MRKIIASVAIVLALCGCGSDSNYNILSSTMDYRTAVLCMPDGTIVTGHVDSWSYSSDSGMVNVKIDGIDYLTHSCNVVLIND